MRRTVSEYIEESALGNHMGIGCNRTWVAKTCVGETEFTEILE